MALTLEFQSKSFTDGCRPAPCLANAPHAHIAPSPSNTLPFETSYGSLCGSGRRSSSVVVVSRSTGAGINKAVLYGCISAGTMVLLMLCVAIFLLMKWRSRKLSDQLHNSAPNFISYDESMEPMVIMGNKKMSTIFYVKVDPNSPITTRKPASDLPVRKTGQVHEVVRLPPRLPSTGRPRVLYAGGINDEVDIPSEKPINSADNPYSTMAGINDEADLASEKSMYCTENPYSTMAGITDEVDILNEKPLFITENPYSTMAGIADEVDVLNEKPLFITENPYSAIEPTRSTIINESERIYDRVGKANRQINLQMATTSVYYAVPVADSGVGPEMALVITNPCVERSFSCKRKMSEQLYISLDQVAPEIRSRLRNGNVTGSRKVSNPLYEPGPLDRKVSNPIYGYSPLPGLSEADTEALYDVPRSPGSSRKQEGVASPIESERKDCNDALAVQDSAGPFEETYSSIETRTNESAGRLTSSIAAVENNNVIYE